MVKQKLYNLINTFWAEIELTEDWGYHITQPLYKGKAILKNAKTTER